VEGHLGAGLIVLAGNSDTTTFTGTAAASRETLGWILSAKAAGAYGTGRAPDGTHQASALNGTGQLRLDRKPAPCDGAPEVGPRPSTSGLTHHSGRMALHSDAMAWEYRVPAR
jgi:hypothetical protein